MPMIALDRITAGRNARTVAVAALADDGLRRSIAASGILQPLLLRPVGSEMAGEPVAPAGPVPLEVVLGGRRFAAARALGLTELPGEIRVMTDAEAEAAQIAENVQRETMHPVDQWRALRHLVETHGLSIAQAAGALGYDERLTRQMAQLGRLHPALLALAEIELPAPAQLRRIAAAPATLQKSAAAIRPLVIQRGAVETVDWPRVVVCCERRRIARSVALFDWQSATKPKLAWDEDLFAAPGADDQFTTADLEAFYTHQNKALAAQVAAAAASGLRHQTAVMKDSRSVAFPGGFKAAFGDPQRLRAQEWAFHAVAPDGSIRIETAFDTRAIKAATREALRPAATGSVQERTPATAATPRDGDTATTLASDAAAPTAPPSDASDASPPFNKKGLALIAAARTRALHAALDAQTLGESQTLSPAGALALLVLALTAHNLRVRGDYDGFDSLAGRLLHADGSLRDLSETKVVAIGATALGRILRCDGLDSGPAADWVGAALEAAQHFARFDSEDVLDTASHAELRRIAAGCGLLATGSAAALRERLAGRVPDWRPAAARFGAPGPQPRAAQLSAAAAPAAVAEPLSEGAAG